MQLLPRIKILTPLSLLFFILSGCQTLQPPVNIHDEDLYYLKGASGAVEMHFLTSGQTDLTKAQWDAISEGMVAMPLAAFDDFNDEIGQLCSEDTCDYDTVQAIQDLVTRLKAKASVNIKR